MIIGVPHYQTFRERGLQLLRDHAEQLVSARKPVPVVIELHGMGVRIDQDRRPAAGTDRVGPPVRKLVQVIDVRQARQRIRIKPVLLEEFITVRGLLHRILPPLQVQVDHEDQFGPALYGPPEGNGMDIVVFVIGIPDPVEDVIVGLFVPEVMDRLGGFPDILRMDAVELAPPLLFQHLLPADAHHVAETVRNQERDVLPVRLLEEAERQ